MASGLTLEDLRSALATNSNSVKRNDVMALLRAYGFEDQPQGGGSSHCHWKNADCPDLVIGLMKTNRKEVLPDEIKHVLSVFDAYVLRGQKAQSIVFPDWLTDDVLQKDMLVIKPDVEAQAIVLANRDYPECAVQVPLVDLSKGRYMGEALAIGADAAAYADLLGDLKRQYDIERVVGDEGEPRLRVNGSGVVLSLRDACAGDISLRDKVLGEAIRVAHEERREGSPAAMVKDAREVLRSLGCDFEQREGIQWAVLPRHLAKYAGYNRNVGVLPEITAEAVKKLQEDAHGLKRAHAVLVRRQNEMFGDLTASGCEVTPTASDAITVMAPDGSQAVFHRDRAGCVDIAEVRRFAHGLREGKGMAERIRAERALPGEERSL